MPTGCRIRQMIAYAVVDYDTNFMWKSNLENANFYDSTTRSSCYITDPNGRERTVTYNNDPLVPPF